ncbi:TraC family protein [Mesorhizobium sp. CAU 1741]|uniref:TraC family protein n=1 Tax=Mesorhizobium sp. CAU 1741 TaxID=3140366 RepID=UPI00325B2CFC
MKKPSSRIREEIVKLHEQLKAAEAREAERIGRIAVKAGLGDLEIEESDMVAAFAEIAKRFQDRGRRQGKPTTVTSGAAQGQDGAT